MQYGPVHYGRPTLGRTVRELWAVGPYCLDVCREEKEVRLCVTAGSRSQLA
jgi:hypothetical protein